MTDLPDYACQSNQLSCKVLRDEIERLRAEVEQQRLELGITGEACGALDSEVKQLRAEVLEQCRLNGMGGSREAKLLAENEQLRARVAELEAALDHYSGGASEALLRQPLMKESSR